MESTGLGASYLKRLPKRHVLKCLKNFRTWTRSKKKGDSDSDFFLCLSETSLAFNQRTPFADLYETYAGLSVINYASLGPLLIKLIPFYCDVLSFRFANFAWYFPVDNETKLLPEFLFLGANAKFRKAIVILVMSVRLSSCKKIGSE